jgi:hypothetical protein
MGKEYFDYYELGDDCYFVESTGSIVNVKTNQRFKLGQLAAFITRFLVLRVRRSTVAQILQENYGWAPEKANDQIITVINNLQDLIIGMSNPVHPVLNLGSPTDVTLERQASSTNATTLALPIIHHGL